MGMETPGVLELLAADRSGRFPQGSRSLNGSWDTASGDSSGLSLQKSRQVGCFKDGSNSGITVICYSWQSVCIAGFYFYFLFLDTDF